MATSTERLPAGRSGERSASEGSHLEGAAIPDARRDPDLSTRGRYRFPNATEANPQGWLSPSSINEYRDCACCWYYARVLKTPKPDTIHFAIGGGVHKAAEVIGRQILEARAINAEEAVAAGMDDFDHRLANPVDEDGNQLDLQVNAGKYEDLGEAKDDTKRFVDLLVARAPKLYKERGLVGVEYQMVSEDSLLGEGEAGLLVPDVWPFPFKARVDQLYGPSLDAIDSMTDLKTASKRGGPDENGKLQFVLYGTPAHEAGAPWRIGTDIVIKQKTADLETRWANGDGLLSPDNIAWGKGIILDVAERICRGDFPIGHGWNGRHVFEHGEPDFTLAVSWPS